ncbi:MAG: phospho-N-acetylmuramoyl-pentapeptide-transferase [Clostridia bacterium]|nr:phospho-N-acetylmuramoyl-pentapeptide-transferase [Clostridia bacterium]
MSAWVRVALAFAVSLVLSALWAPLALGLLRKLKSGQPILRYVAEHEGKAGTPTMGGWTFILPTFAVTLALESRLGMGAILAFAMLSYAILGFLDDFLKLKRHDNGGLKPYQKIVGQLGIAVLLAVYIYRNPLIGTSLVVPFSAATLDLKWGIIPLSILVWIATTNSVNLTDGLDGLAASTTLVYVLGGMAMVAIGLAKGILPSESADLLVFGGALVASLLIFLFFNASPAKVFMGDTGSMALGGGVAGILCFAKFTFYLPLLGIIYVATSISVIAQVAFFKLSHGKRLLLMAPLHHHLQRKGLSEPQVATSYVTVTFGAAILCVIGVWIGVGGLSS